MDPCTNREKERKRYRDAAEALFTPRFIESPTLSGTPIEFIQYYLDLKACPQTSSLVPPITCISVAVIAFRKVTQ